MSGARLAPRNLTAAGELLKALAAPVRLALVAELSDGPRCVHELVEAVGASQSLVSQHLRVLRGAGVVTSSRRGREIAYRLVDEHVAHIARDAIRHADHIDQSAAIPEDPVPAVHEPTPADQERTP